jgi:hypothetical protein
MRTSPFKLISGLVIVAALLLSIGTSAVLAKTGVSVNLLAPLPGDAAPGTVVPALFTMSAIYDDVVSPLHKASVFIRLHGPTGATTEAAGVEQTTSGTYKAMIEIPAGGVAGAEFGIHGQAKTSSGRVVATDPVWSYDGEIVSARIQPPAPAVNQPPAKQPAPAQPATGASSSVPPTATSQSLDPRLGLVAVLALLAVLAIALSRRRLRSTAA